MKIRLSAPITTESIVDGAGLRAVIWTQGCFRNCPSCHNPQTHDINGGFEESIDSIKQKLKSIKLHKGITFSGGEPFLQSEKCTEIAKFARSIGLDIWCFTGYTYEELILNEKNKKFLEQIDVLVDGPFIENQKSYELVFRGSRNQRHLHLKNGEVLKAI